VGKRRSKPTAEEVSFEENLEHLENIVVDLESGNLSLDEALARYEEGVKRLRGCHAALAQAERKIEILAGVRADGTVIAEPFDEAETSLEEKQAARAQRRSSEPNESDSDIDESPRLF
jgi:exodeoxyribonuclease VII small subunit